MAKTDATILAQAQVILNEINARANTPVRVGGTLQDLVTEKINNDKIDTDITLSGNSDLKVASQKAIKAYVSSFSLPITVKVSVLASDIAVFFSAPKILIAAPGAGLFINPLSIGFMMKSGTIIYATQTGVLLSLGSSLGTIVSVLDNTASNTKYFSVAAQNYFVNNASNVNAALYMSSPIANPTAGNGAIDVYITYQIVTV